MTEQVNKVETLTKQIFEVAKPLFNSNSRGGTLTTAGKISQRYLRTFRHLCKITELIGALHLLFKNMLKDEEEVLLSLLRKNEIAQGDLTARIVKNIRRTPRYKKILELYTPLIEDIQKAIWEDEAPELVGEIARRHIQHLNRTPSEVIEETPESQTEKVEVV